VFLFRRFPYNTVARFSSCTVAANPGQAREGTDIASDPSPVKEVGNLTSEIASYHRFALLEYF